MRSINRQPQVELAGILICSQRELLVRRVGDDKLALRMITLPKKCRFVFYAMLANGYKLRKVQALGKFDVTLVKEQPTS